MTQFHGKNDFKLLTHSKFWKNTHYVEHFIVYHTFMHAHMQLVYSECWFLLK